MATFQEFVQSELPLRQVVIFGAFNPTLSGQPAAIGSYFLDNSSGSGPYIRYEKIGSSATEWRIVPPSATDISGLSNTLETVSAIVYETLYSNIESTKTTLAEYISYEWNPNVVKQSSTIKLSNGKIYMLASSDGSSTTHYIEMNMKPVSPFITTGLISYGTVDSFALNDFKSCKYTIEVFDTALNKSHYSEINVLCDGAEVAVAEYGSLFSTGFPLVEYGGTTNGVIVSLTANSITGNMLNKVFKGIRTNFF